MPVLVANKRAIQQKRCSVKTGLLIFQMLLLLTTGLRAQTPLAKEYQVKALFLYNFTQFVAWPAESFSAPQTPLVIGILGEDPFGSYIDELVQGETIGDHPLVVERYEKVDDVAHCHILYINLADKDAIRQALNSLKSRAILTVSDGENFARMGGIVQFVHDSARIRLRINTTAATTTPLVMSSKLLRVSEVITTKNN